MSRMRVAVVGAGISGMVSAYVLAKEGVEVVLYEKENCLGGHAKTVTADGLDLDLGFMLFNRVTYPNLTELFESLGVEMEDADMSFSVSLSDDKGKGCQWDSRNGLSANGNNNSVNPQEILKFNKDVASYLEEIENNTNMDISETLGNFIDNHNYSKLFQKAYIVPICTSIWHCPSEDVMNLSAYSVLSFCRNHHLLQPFDQPQWLTVKRRSHNYVHKVKEELLSKGCQIRSGCGVRSVTTVDERCAVMCEDGSEEMYDRCIIAAHAPDALKILGAQVTCNEARILGAFPYVHCDVFLHRDKTLMPKNPEAWSGWNFLGTGDDKVCVTHWLNVLQNLGETGLPYLVTLDPPRTPEHSLVKWSTRHAIPSVAATKASLELDQIQGKRGIWFSGAYQGYGFHEDGVKAGMHAAHGLLGGSCPVSNNPKPYMVPYLQNHTATGGCSTSYSRVRTMLLHKETTTIEGCFISAFS